MAATVTLRLPSIQTNRTLELLTLHPIIKLFALNQTTKFSPCSKLKAFADNHFHLARLVQLLSDKKYLGKSRKCLLPAFSPFPTVFSKDFSKGP